MYALRRQGRVYVLFSVSALGALSALRALITVRVSEHKL